MNFPPTIPLAIQRNTENYLDGRTLYEHIPLTRVEALIASNYPKDIWVANRYGVVKDFDSERTQLKCYAKTYNHKLNAFPVKYVKPKHKWGRLVVADALGCSAFSKRIRNTLLKGLYYDFDLKNAQPEIIRNICINNGIKCPKVVEYCNNREEILNRIADEMDVERKVAKKLMLRLCFFGTFKGFCEENFLGDKSCPDFVNLFSNELREIANETRLHNTELYETARQLKESKKEKNFIGSFYALYLQEWETRIVQTVTHYVSANTDLMNHIDSNATKTGIYEYDGVKTEVGAVDKFPKGKEGVKQFLNEKTKELTGFDLEWEEKEIDDAFDISEIEANIIAENNANKQKTIFVETDFEASTAIYNLLKNDIKFSRGNLYFKEKNLWVSDRDVIESLINVYVNNVKLATMTAKGKIEPYASRRGGCVSITRGVIDLAVSHSDDGWFDSIFSSSLGKILFENGYWDFKQGKFYKNEDTDFDKSIIFMEIIPYKFRHLDTFTDAELDATNQLYKKLFTDPFGEEVAEFYCEKLARGLAGDCQKSFIAGIGASNTGKSTITSALRSSCGGYFGSFNGANLLYKQGDADEAQKLRWMMLLQYKRLIVSNELPMGVNVDGNMIKKCSNGGLDPIVARGHCANENSFRVGFLPILFANDIDKISPMDDAVKKRMGCIHYEKVYVDDVTNDDELLIDRNFDNEIATYDFKMRFIWLLINAYKKFHEDKKRKENTPEGVQKAFSNIVGDSQSVVDKFLEMYEITGDETDVVPSAKIEAFLKTQKVSMMKFGVEFKKYLKQKKIEGVYNKHNSAGRMVWVGLKRVLEECNEI